MLHFDESFQRKAGINFQEYEKIIKEICNDLDINDLNIFVETSPHAYSAEASSIKNELTGEYIYTIKFNCYNFVDDVTKFTFVAAHELRHVYQYRNNLLSKECLLVSIAGMPTNNMVMLWNNKLYLFCEKTQFDVPWESDANFYAFGCLDKKNLIVDEKDDESFWGNILNKIYEYYETKYDENNIQHCIVPYYSSLYINCFKLFKEMNYIIEE